jgi:hypothetical protein
MPFSLKSNNTLQYRQRRQGVKKQTVKKDRGEKEVIKEVHIFYIQSKKTLNRRKIS